MAVDPVTIGRLTHPQAWNKYTYALNNPLILVDPDGQDLTLAPGLKNRDAKYLNRGFNKVNATSIGNRVMEILDKHERKIVVKTGTLPPLREEIDADGTHLRGTAAITSIDKETGDVIIIVDKSHVAKLEFNSDSEILPEVLLDELFHALKMLYSPGSYKSDDHVLYEEVQRAFSAQVRRTDRAELRSSLPKTQELMQIMEEAAEKQKDLVEQGVK